MNEIERLYNMWPSLKNNPVPPRDIIDYAGTVSQAIEYFRDLDTVEVTGAQVATLFDSLIAQGRFPTEATDDAGLPEWPEWLL